MLSENDAQDQAWFEPGDSPPSFPRTAVRVAEVKSWNGRTAIIEHDGACILILRRAFYPGWFYRLDGGPPEYVLKVNCGMQAVPLVGSGTRRVDFDYKPTGLKRAVTVSLTALAAALFAVLWAAIKALQSRAGAQTQV